MINMVISKISGKKGFTLTEILVLLAIISISILLIIGNIVVANKLKEKPVIKEKPAITEQYQPSERKFSGDYE